MRRVANAPFELTGKTVYVAGHRGMVGSAIVRRLAREEVRLVIVDRREGNERRADKASAEIQDQRKTRDRRRARVPGTFPSTDVPVADD